MVKYEQGIPWDVPETTWNDILILSDVNRNSDLKDMNNELKQIEGLIPWEKIDYKEEDIRRRIDQVARIPLYKQRFLNREEGIQGSVAIGEVFRLCSKILEHTFARLQAVRVCNQVDRPERQLPFVHRIGTAIEISSSSIREVAQKCAPAYLHSQIAPLFPKAILLSSLIKALKSSQPKVRHEN